MTSEEILHRRGRPSRDSAMTEFETRRLPATRDVVAPDGSDVRVLLGLGGGGMAHFELAPGLTSCAMAHRTVEEIWFFVGGRGEMWRKSDTREEVVSVEPVPVTVSITWPNAPEARSPSTNSKVIPNANFMFRCRNVRRTFSLP